MTGCESVVKLCEAAVRRLYYEPVPSADFGGSGGNVNLKMWALLLTVVTQGKSG